MAYINEWEMVEKLSTSKRPRATIYLNEKRVDEYYSQRLGPITQLAKTGKFGGHLGANLLGILNSELESGREMAGSGAITPILKAILIESEARDSDQLSNLSLGSTRDRILTTYLGPGRIFDTEDEVCADEAIGVPADAAQVIQNERARQQKVLRGPTLVWMAWAAEGPVASVCHDSQNNINRSYLASYPFSPFGILGFFERELSNVQFITPFWIWHDGP